LVARGYKGPHPLLWATSRVARRKIGVSGIPNSFSCCVIVIAYTQLTNLTEGCIIDGGSRGFDAHCLQPHGLLTRWCRVLEKLTGLQLVKKFPRFTEPEGSLPHSQASTTSEKLTGLQLVKKFSAFHATRRFVTAPTNVRHLSLSQASPIQSIYPHPTYWRSILILSTHLRLGLPSGLLTSGFPTKALYTPLSSPMA